MARRALITGIQGFTGRYLEQKLESAGWEVWGLGIQPSANSQRYFQRDLRDKASLEEALQCVQPDAVIHLAAITFVDHSDARAFYDVNVIGTRNLLEVLARLPALPSHVLLTSSANIYGNSVCDPLSEMTPPNPVNDYAVSKLAMEYMASLWQDRLPITMVRPFNYTGVGQSNQFLLPKIVEHFQNKAGVIELGNTDIQRDFCDVRDVVDAYCKLLNSESAVNKVINVCSGRVVSVHEIFYYMMQTAGHAMEVTTNPELVRDNEVQILRGDPTRLREVLGNWNPRPIEETLAWMLTEEPGSTQCLM